MTPEDLDELIKEASTDNHRERRERALDDELEVDLSPIAAERMTLRCD